MREPVTTTSWRALSWRITLRRNGPFVCEPRGAQCKRGRNCQPDDEFCVVFFIANPSRTLYPSSESGVGMSNAHVESNDPMQALARVLQRVEDSGTRTNEDASMPEWKLRVVALFAALSAAGIVGAQERPGSNPIARRCINI